MGNGYLTTKVSVNCVIQKDGKFLLVKQARPKHAKGKWSLPGGKVNNGEIFKDAVKREIKEEIGLKIIKAKHIDIIQETPIRTVKHIFRVEVEIDDKNNIKFNKQEILDVKWFSFIEIRHLKFKNKLRGDWVLKAIQLLTKKDK